MHNKKLSISFLGLFVIGLIFSTPIIAQSKKKLRETIANLNQELAWLQKKHQRVAMKLPFSPEGQAYKKNISTRDGKTITSLSWLDTTYSINPPDAIEHKTIISTTDTITVLMVNGRVAKSKIALVAKPSDPTHLKTEGPAPVLDSLFVALNPKEQPPMNVPIVKLTRDEFVGKKAPAKPSVLWKHANNIFASCPKVQTIHYTKGNGIAVYGHFTEKELRTALNTKL